MPAIFVLFCVFVAFFYGLIAYQVRLGRIGLAKARIKVPEKDLPKDQRVVAGEPVISPKLRDNVRLAYAATLQNNTAKGIFPCLDISRLPYPKILIKTVLSKKFFLIGLIKYIARPVRRIFYA